MMNRFGSRLLAASALAAGFVAAAAPAQAQRIERIVAFGDSYADDGNLFELLGIPRPAVYPNGRFSNGTNFIDTLSQILSVPVDNFAIGGAFTGNGNINGPGIPGFVTEYQSFLAGGGPAAFPRVSGSFGPQDLVAISIGGNDARAYERSLGLAPSSAQIAGLIAGVPAQAQARVTETTTGLNALYAAGARNFTFLVGDVGRLPEVRGLPVAAVGTAYANAYNAGIQNSLSTIAAQGAIVNYLDLSLIGNVVEGNLAAFGLQSAGACPIACVTTNPELLDRYLFYVDQVHLTSAGFAIVGRYAARQLEAPLHLEAQADTALTVATSFGDLLDQRLDLGSADEGEGPPLRLFATGSYAQSNRDASQTSLGHRSEGFTGAIGVEYDGGQWLAGAIVGTSRGETELNGATGRIESDALHLGAYASWSNGNAFIEAYGGLGRVDLDIRRDAVIDEIEAAPQADTMVAGARLGYLFDLGQLKVGPFVGIDFARAQIESYTEAGDPVLTLNVSDQEDDQMVGSLGIELNGDFDVGGNKVAPFLTLAAQKELDDNPRTIRYALTAAPTIVNSWTVGGDSEEAYGRIGAGVNFELTRNFTLQVAGGTTVGQEQGDESSASVALRLGF